MSQSRAKTESERRIRAGVQAVLSSGVWLAIGLQVVALILFVREIIPLLTSETLGAGLSALMTLFVVVLIIYAYVMSGTSRAFAVGQTTVSVRQTLDQGREVFSQFLLLSVKMLLLILLALYLLGMIVQIIAATASTEVPVVFARIFPGLMAIVALIPFALVYWLPIVFVRNDFRIFPTLQSALRILWRRLSKSGFLAFLILFPLALLWLLPGGTPFLIALGVSVLGQIMAWIAYIYCVDSVIQSASATVSDLV